MVGLIRFRVVAVASSVAVTFFLPLPFLLLSHRSDGRVKSVVGIEANSKVMIKQVTQRPSGPSRKQSKRMPTSQRLELKQSSIALFPIDQDDWNRLDNQKCLEGKQGVLEEWQKRLPSVVIGGTMKGGTEALWSYLKQHPQVVGNAKKEQHFFDKGFEAFATPEGIQRDGARRAYAQLYENQLKAHREAFEKNSSLVGMDNTPRYMFWSDRIPARLLCVAPWVKIIFLLRNPVARAYSHYMYTLNENFHTKPKAMLQESFEDWIGYDMKQLNESGVLDDPTDVESWKTYLRTMPEQTYAILGKGLYVIQLRHWFAAMEKIGKSRDDVLILESQYFKEHTQEEYDEVVKFLGLPSYSLNDPSDRHKGHYSDSIKQETQDRLESFFRPFNKELYELLGWEHVWDESFESEVDEIL